MPEWISIKDRTPEPYVNVLVFTPSNMPDDYVREAFFDASGNCFSRRVVHGLTKVTHWMPLPLPPMEYLEKYIKGGNYK